MDATWDPEKAISNRQKHGIRFSDAESALWDPHALTMEDNDSEGEQRFITIGRDATDQILFVCYTYQDEMIRIISARKANKNEVHQYEN